MTSATDPATPRTPGAAVQRLRATCTTLLAALVLLGLSWELWLAPTGRGTLALKVLPLLAAVPGLLRHRMYTYRWLSLLVWLYFGEGVLRATSEVGLSQQLAVLAVALSLGLFIACTFYIRRRLQPAAAHKA
jgi:uncharacterized membrane protein